MQHHGGVLPVWAAGGFGVPAGLDQPHKRLAGARQRRRLIGGARAIAVIVFPLGDQRIPVRLQGGVELRGVRGKPDPLAAALFGLGRGDRALGLAVEARVRAAAPD